MKIVHLVPSMESGGVEQVVLELGRGFSAQGVENIVISGGGRMVEQLEKEGSRHILMPIGKKSLSTFFRVGALRALLQAIRPDILHLQSRVPAWAGYLAWKKLPQTLINVRYAGGADPLQHPEVVAACDRVTTELAGRGRVLLRKSGTEPLVRVMVEGEDKAVVLGYAQQLAEVVEQCCS